MQPKVLITSAGRKVSLVKSFQEAGWHVTTRDDEMDSAAHKFADCNSWGSISKDCYDLVIPTRDAELLEWSHPTKVNLPYLVAKKGTIETCLDKFKFYRFCKTHGFKTPEVYFVKPRISKSGKETECVWQKYVEGEEHSIDIFADFSGNVVSAVPRQRLKIVNGESWVSQTVKNVLLIEQSIRLSKMLGLVGHNCLQSFVDASNIIWTDVNCRFGGASALAIKAGCNSPLWLKELIEGKEIKPRIGDYKVGLKMYRYTQDYFEEINRGNELPSSVCCA